MSGVIDLSGGARGGARGGVAALSSSYDLAG
eukprot:COSAG02_NODE_14826_length_1232_cov_1.514563_2_plen_30_part_01